MFSSTHAAAGIFISQHVSNPWAIIGLSLASHFALDFIPHGDEGFYHDHEWKDQHKYRRVIGLNLADMTILLFLVFWTFQYVAPPNPDIMILAIVAAIIPDILEYFFPVIHQQFSWLFLVRWIYSLTKPTGLRYLVRAQNWLHDLLHHEIFRHDIRFRYGLAMQVIIAVVLLNFSR